MDDDIVEQALSIVENVASTDRLNRLDASSALLAASDVVRANVALNTPKTRLAAMCMFSAARTAYAVLQGASERKPSSYYASYAARAAASVANAVDVLDEPAAVLATRAARRDYETLLKVLGESETVTVGEAIDLSEASFLGPLI
jgi:hypothetical protein